MAGLHQVLDAGHKVYVYCTAGINRAPLTVLGYLTFIEGMSRDAGFRLILEARPVAEPYWEAYEGCYRDLLDTYREDIKRRAFEVSLLHPENDQAKNWREAEFQIIRAALVDPGSTLFDGRNAERT